MASEDNQWCWLKSPGNASEPDVKVSIDMCFNAGHVVSIVTYSVLMVVSAVGNITVLAILLSRRKSARSRINLMLMHLAIADLLVTFLMMPLEIGWAATVSWWAGDSMCRIMAFFRVFGLFLSSFVLVCISIDRYLAILRPMNIQGVDRRGKLMLLFAWVFSIFCSMPQTYIFHVEAHPNHTWYKQCVTYHTLPSPMHELAYYLFGMIMMYGLPLVAIIFSYASILLEIVRRSRENADGFRRSGLGFLGRAKIRTLKMTIIIVLVFFVCWTPYYVMCLWYWVDKESAAKVDQRVQRGLFMFACTNSCMNPIVYGVFNIRARRAQQGGVSRQNGVHNNRTLGCSTATSTPGDATGPTKVVWLVSWRKPSQDSVRLYNGTNKATNGTNKAINSTKKSLNKVQS